MSLRAPASSRIARPSSVLILLAARHPAAQQHHHHHHHSLPRLRPHPSTILPPWRSSPARCSCRCLSHSARRQQRQQRHDNDYNGSDGNGGDGGDDFRQRLRRARPLVPDALADKFAAAGRGRNSRAFAVAAALAAVVFYLVNSQTVPVTGRRRFNFLSDALVASAYSKAAEQIIAQVEAQGGRFLSDWDPRTMLVKRVMKRLIPVSGMEDLDWEVRVIADNRTANAFVIPGGKVFVHSGILNVCRSEDALAAVLGHEIAHNTASHAAERLSAAWVGNLTVGSLFFLAGALPGLALFGLWNFIGGFYLQDLLFYLPMGRKQESEADYIGLMMMAEACYDPRQAVGFWQRMEAIQRSGGQEVPEMLSTHPSNENRIAKIYEWMPEAMRKQAESDCRGTMAFADRFRAALRRRGALDF